jgi:phenylalanyl-tRNA synthetase alpha chain
MSLGIWSKTWSWFVCSLSVESLLMWRFGQIDDFVHPKMGRRSKCYRLNYRSMDRCVSLRVPGYCLADCKHRSLSNEEVNVLQAEVERRVVAEMDIEMR